MLPRRGCHVGEQSRADPSPLPCVIHEQEIEFCLAMRCQRIEADDATFVFLNENDVCRKIGRLNVITFENAVILASLGA